VTRCDHVRPRIVAPYNVRAILAPLCKGSCLRSRLRGCKVGIRTINNPSVCLASLRLPPSLAQGGQGVPLLRRGAEDVAPCNVRAIMAPLCKGSWLRSRLKGCKVGIRTINNPSVSLASLRLPPSLAQGGQGDSLLRRSAENVAPCTAFLRIPLIRLVPRHLPHPGGRLLEREHTARRRLFVFPIHTKTGRFCRPVSLTELYKCRRAREKSRPQIRQIRRHVRRI
jgi:hypothetical protein